jgi:hypothetical protein
LEGTGSFHSLGVADFDLDGDLNIATKVWNADGPNHHADFWRNDIIK